jgi:hypothetical protein
MRNRRAALGALSRCPTSGVWDGGTKSTRAGTARGQEAGR